MSQPRLPAADSSSRALVRLPHPRRLLIVIGLGLVAFVLGPMLLGLVIIDLRFEYELAGWLIQGLQLGIVVATVGTLVLLRRRDFASLRRARDAYAATHPDAVVEAVSFDPLWIPPDAERPRNPSTRTYGLVAADANGLSVIEEGTVILAAGWDDLSDFGPGPSISFVHGDHHWGITPDRRGALARLAVVRPAG